MLLVVETRVLLDVVLVVVYRLEVLVVSEDWDWSAVDELDVLDVVEDGAVEDFSELVTDEVAELVVLESWLVDT